MTSASVLTIAALGALVLALGINVTRLRATRGAEGDQFPTDPSDALFKAVRAHGNAAEYVPVLAVLVLVVGLQSAGPAVVVLMAAAVVFRLVHAVAILTSDTLALNTVPRSIGAAGTYLTGLALAVTAVVTM